MTTAGPAGTSEHRDHPLGEFLEALEILRVLRTTEGTVNYAGARYLIVCPVPMTMDAAASAARLLSRPGHA